MQRLSRPTVHLMTTTIISPGHNLFVSAYHGFAQMGNEHLPQPAVYPKFPETKITSVSGRIVGSSNLKIDCRILLLDCTDPHRFRFAARIQLTRPGGGLNQSLMRSFMGNTVAWTQVQGGYGILVSFLVPENKNMWNLNWHESTFHLYGQFIEKDKGQLSEICHINDTSGDKNGR